MFSGKVEVRRYLVCASLCVNFGESKCLAKIAASAFIALGASTGLKISKAHHPWYKMMPQRDALLSKKHSPLAQHLQLLALLPPDWVAPKLSLRSVVSLVACTVYTRLDINSQKAVTAS